MQKIIYNLYKTNVWKTICFKTQIIALLVFKLYCFRIAVIDIVVNPIFITLRQKPKRVTRMFFLFLFFNAECV